MNVKHKALVTVLQTVKIQLEVTVADATQDIRLQITTTIALVCDHVYRYIYIE